jgi:protein-arginine kinase activator protein McsA
LDSYKRLLVDRASLKQELEEALKREDYETAASLRDRMRSMEEAHEDL